MTVGNHNHLQLAQLAFQKGDLNKAKLLAQEWLRENERDDRSRTLLGLISLRQNKLKEAKEWLESSLKFNNKNADTFYLLAIVYTNYKDLDKTVFCLEKVTEINPKHVDALKNLAEVLIQNFHLIAAGRALEKVMKLEPLNTSTLNKLAFIYLESNQIDKAIDYYHKTLELSPELSLIRSNLLLALNYLEHKDQNDVISVIQEQSSLLKKLSPKKRQLAVNFNKHDKIRIGYVSADFRNHSVFNFLNPLLKQHNKSKFKLYAYYTNNIQDEKTSVLKKGFDHWRDVSDLSDQSMVQQIIIDEIDILVDLTGHMAKNRLGVFAAKPSPIQVTWLGYPNTTGLKEIDYRLVDAISDPIENTDFYTEKRIRLPNSFLCYEGPKDIGYQTVLPCSKEAPFTFASFNNLTKITDSVISTWSEILKQVPKSRLLLKSRQLDDPEIRESLFKKFEHESLDPSRIVLLQPTLGNKEHMECYNRADLALDTFPYNGTTTTCEALWMGVPTICFPGSVHASRVSASIMSNAGLEEFIATNKEDYIKKAVYWSNNLVELQKQRSNLRERVTNSNLCNAEQFTKNIESAFLDMINNAN